MKVVLDNNLPWRMAGAIRSLLPDIDLAHLSELNASNWTDNKIRRNWRCDFIVWVTRDEDFWLDAPAQWAVVWVNCHNPKLSFLKTTGASMIAQNLPSLNPGARLVITDDVALSL